MKYGYGFRQTQAEGQAEAPRRRSGNRHEFGCASKIRNMEPRLVGRCDGEDQRAQQLLFLQPQLSSAPCGV